jgi:hypothetical protein
MNWQRNSNSELIIEFGFLQYTVSGKSWKCICKLADGSVGLVATGKGRSQPDSARKAEAHFFRNILPNLQSEKSS